MSESVLPQPENTREIGRISKALFWKEFRELGYYAVSIILFGMGFLLLTISIDFSKTFGLQVGPGQASIANVLPLLVLLACASSAFSIEHENKSYNWLRSLPIPAWQLLYTKLTSIVILTTVSCFVSWPFAYYLILKDGPDKANFVGGLGATVFSMVEAMLWATLFSLREKQVVRALVKACLGLILVSNGFSLLSWIDIGNYELDGLYFWLKVSCRVLVGVCLVVAIRSNLKTWGRDAELSSAASGRHVKAIEGVRTSKFSSFGRLVWIQLRTAWLPLVTIAAFSLWLVYVSVHYPKDRFLKGSFGHFYWSLTIAAIGSLSLTSLSRKSRLLVTSGYRPIQIWLSQTSIPFVFCLLSACLFWTWYPQGEFALSFFLCIAVTSFFTGQMAGFIWSSPIMAMFLALVFGFLSFLWLALSATAFPTIVPSVLLLALVPIILVGCFYKTKALEGRLTKKFWFAWPICVIIFALPMPFMRIYQVPNVSLESIESRFVRPEKVPVDKLAELREVADDLYELYNPVTQPKQIAVAARQNRDGYWRKEDLIQIRSHALATKAIQSNASMEMLLNNDEGDPEDLNRAIRIKQAINQLINDTVYAKHRNRSPKVPPVDFEIVNNAIMNYDRWSFGAPSQTTLHWWLTRKQVTRQHVEDMLSKLENFDPFDRYRIFESARIRYATAALRLDPRIYPNRIFFYPREKFWYYAFVKTVPWEAARFKRQQRRNVKNTLDTIDILEANGDRPIVQNGVPIVQENNRRRYQSLFSNFAIGFHHYSGEAHPHYVLWNNIAKTYLALNLWRIDHDGELPDDLAKLKSEGYLYNMPTEPMLGQSFLIAPKGMNWTRLDQSLHADLAEELSQLRDLNQFDVPQFPDGVPFFWVNMYRDPKHTTYRRGIQLIDINSVEDFAEKKGVAYVNTFLLLEIDKDWK